MNNNVKELLAVHDEFQDMILEKKYYHAGETNWQDVVDRLNRTFIMDRSAYDFILDKYFIPGGSILANAGSKQDLSMSNCYYIPIKEDSLSEIFDCNKYLAEISKRRGGCGFSLDNLRPKGCKVNNSAKTSSGAVSFLPLFNSTGLVVGQGGRRMAMIALMDIRHPDVLDFIWCKSKPEKVFKSDSFTTSTPDLSMMNISLKITDDFMQAVEEDQDWNFIYPEINDYYFKHWGDGDFDTYKGEMKVYKTMPAREVFNQIMESSFISGDPGIMFIDNHNRNCFHNKLKKRGTNPCGEIGTANYENCLLGHLNLPKFVKNPYTINAEFDMSLFKDAVAVGVEFLNIVSQENRHPLQSQNIMDVYSRQIGLGITGFADLCAMLRLDYEHNKEIEYIMRIKAITEMKTSNQLVKHGKFKRAEVFNEEGVIDRFIDTPYMRNLQYYPINKDDFLTKQDITDIKEYGLANSSFSTVAPTGSVSIIADNCSSGIEPVFKLEYIRKNRIDNVDRRFIHKPILKYYDDKVLPINYRDFFNYKEASEINYRDRIEVQALVQRYTTNSISSTLNLPSDTTIDDLKTICILAWKKGIKGYTTFIEGNKSGVLLSVDKEEKAVDKQRKIEYKRELLDIETSERHRVAWKKARLYLNVSLDEDGSPIEIFSDLPKSAGVDGKSGIFNPMIYLERLSNWHFITRLISNALRYGIPLKELIEQAEKSSFSLVDAPGIISRILKKYLTSSEESFSICPECNENSIVNEGGCIQCVECGYSKCS